jgi:hypothetical protein
MLKIKLTKRKRNGKLCYELRISKLSITVVYPPAGL